MSDLCVFIAVGPCPDGFLSKETAFAVPYHGWKFQPDGECIEIPANPPDRRPIP